jgi:predicted ATP-binding protein involved in virulence
MLSSCLTLPFKQFAIYGLYADRNIIIPFNQAAKILVSENGLGKTTVLNTLNAVLTRQFFKLTSLDFESIVLTFFDDKIIIYQSDLVPIEKEETLLAISEKINRLVQEKVLYFPAHRQMKANLNDFLASPNDLFFQEAMNLKPFIKVCNRYLVDKQLVYYDNSSELEMVLTKNNRPITLEKLSFGEKQIISIFSKLYLTVSSKNIVIFDEPELSISMEWQKMLLPDVLNSPQCQGVIAATHSPFIFNNDLNVNTVDLNEYIEDIYYVES